MAFLNHVRALVAACLCTVAIGSCSSSAPLGHVEAWLRDCQGASDTCDAEYVEAQAFIDPAASRYAPDGFYAYFELQRADGRVGLFELDVPTDAAEDAALPHFEASYHELSGERVRFASRGVRGQLVVPDSHADGAAADCACTDTGFELTFIDAGDDGVTGSADDATRRLSLGRMGWSDRFCLPQQVLAVGSDLRVTRAACDAPGTATPGEQPVATAPRYGEPVEYVAVVPEPTPAYYADESDGCSSSSDADSSHGDGCSSSSDRNAPSSDATSVSSADGSDGSCEGDSTSSSAGACEGDSSDDESDASSCSIQRAAVRPVHHSLPLHRRRGNPFVGTGVPLLVAWLVQVARARYAARSRKLI